MYLALHYYSPEYSHNDALIKFVLAINVNIPGA